MSPKLMCTIIIRRRAVGTLVLALATWVIIPLAVQGQLGPSTAAAQSIGQPASGSELRRAVLDSARPIFASETGGDVEFVVRRLNVLGDWAFGDVTLQRPGGRAIDWRRTKFANAIKNGEFDAAGSFFLARRTPGGWQVLAFAIGPTDIAWDGWDKQFGAPRAIFDRGY